MLFKENVINYDYTPISSVWTPYIYLYTPYINTLSLYTPYICTKYTAVYTLHQLNSLT